MQPFPENAYLRVQMLFPNPNDEKRLLKGLMAEKPEAQRQLFELFSGKMMALCFRYAKSREEAEDILQEGFLRVFRKIDSFQGSGSLEGWIRKVFTNVAIRHYQKNRRIFIVEGMDDLEEEPSMESIDHFLAAEDLLKMVQSLPDGYRMVFNLYAIEGYSHEEIAAELGISEGTSKSQLARARKALQRMIEQEEGSTRKEAVHA
jgi:RNA polymerase sigma-70 factor (ECF subfamily)